MNDRHFKAEIVFKGLRYSTSMVFFGGPLTSWLRKRIVVRQEDCERSHVTATSRDVNVTTYGHRGMLGIAVDSSLLNDGNVKWHSNITATRTMPTYVFRY